MRIQFRHCRSWRLFKEYEGRRSSYVSRMKPWAGHTLAVRIFGYRKNNRWEDLLCCSECRRRREAGWIYGEAYVPYWEN